MTASLEIPCEGVIPHTTAAVHAGRACRDVDDFHGVGESSRGCRLLESPATIEVFKQVSFVRLVPTHLVRRKRSEIETIDQRGRDQPADQLGIIRYSGDDKAGSEPRGNLILIDRHYTRKWKQKLAVRERMFRSVARYHRWQ